MKSYSEPLVREDSRCRGSRQRYRSRGSRMLCGSWCGPVAGMLPQLWMLPRLSMLPRLWMLLRLSLIVVLVTAGDLPAQDPAAPTPPPATWDLPDAVAEEVIQRLNDPAVDVREGDVSVTASSPVVSDLAIVEGDLSVAGSINGDVIVVNGDIELLPGASITGNLTVLGGVLTRNEGRVGGEIITYAQLLTFERMAGRFRLVLAPRIAAAEAERAGSSDFLIATGKSYNRVEGMPIAFGPRLETEGSNPFRLQALGIYRSEIGLRFDPAEMGYFVRAEQFIGGHREYRVGAELYSLIDPIEEWQVTDLESGLATFLFHRDFRDHYARQGWSLTADWEPAGRPHRIHIENRWESHDTRVVGSPWSLFRNAEAWRPQPIIAEGSFASIRALGEYDSRSSVWNPASGWLARVLIEHAFRAHLVQPDMVSPPSPGIMELRLIVPGRTYGSFSNGLVDLRSYNRVNAQSRLNLRLVAGGSLTGDALPPQRQHALGGEGSLPGYVLFSADCGARASHVLVASEDPDGAVYHSAYGCDAFTLLQAEFRGKLAFRFRWDAAPGREDDDSADRVWDFGWDMAPDWALFVDAARAWGFDDRPDEATRVNVGAGILLERIGLYLAVPLTGGTGTNIFLRLGPRF
jgi:hypothetical protein